MSIETQVHVLLVDDQMIVVEAVRRMLAGHSDITFHFATDDMQALAVAERVAPSVILQDLVMPTVGGFALIAQYRASAILCEVPVVVLSAMDDPELRAHSFAKGAIDYLVKLPAKDELLARLRYHGAGYHARRERDEALRQLAEANEALRRLGENGIAQ